MSLSSNAAKQIPRRAVMLLVAAATVAWSGTTDTLAPTAATTVALESVSPANGATSVSVTIPMVMRFSTPMGNGMEAYMAVHEASVTGPLVAGMWSWSTDHRVATFTPNAPLKAHTTYVIHMGGGVQGANGHPVDTASCTALGGRSVTSGMMGGGMSGMMGNGWRRADGTYGMIFSFTTV